MTIADRLAAALKQLLRETLEAGFATATDYNWPKAINDAHHALADYEVGVTMADLQTTIFVVAHDGGCEGHSLPVLAFPNKADAVLWCLGQSEAYDIAEVPVFPNLPSKPWFNLEPVTL